MNAQRKAARRRGRFLFCNLFQCGSKRYSDPMFDEPSESPQERVIDPRQRAAEKADEFRIHAEVCAVFEGPRKFEAEINVALSDKIARDVQKRIAKLEKLKLAGMPIIDPQ